MALWGWTTGREGVTVRGEPKVTELEIGKWAAFGRVGVNSSVSRG